MKEKKNLVVSQTLVSLNAPSYLLRPDFGRETRAGWGAGGFPSPGVLAGAGDAVVVTACPSEMS